MTRWADPPNPDTARRSSPQLMTWHPAAVFGVRRSSVLGSRPPRFQAISTDLPNPSSAAEGVPMAVVAGIDGCPSGWLCLTKDLATGTVQARILNSISDLLALAPRPEVVMVDVPIGLTDAGPRKCDLEARAHLKPPRSSSVFPAPIRPTLVATTYAQACQIGEAADGRKLSQQAWAILPKIREVDTFLRTDATLNQWIREVHPEVCFWAWRGNKAMAHRKKSPAGKAEREALVKPVYGTAYTAAQSSLPRGQYGNDDLLDAFAALWSGERVVAGKQLLLPAMPPLDSCGLRMEMVA